MMLRQAQTRKYSPSPDYYNSQRQTVTEMRQANKLGAQLAKRFHQTGAVEILTKFRSVLEGIENCVSTEQALAPESHGQLQDWEGLHHEGHEHHRCHDR